jgi:hypothetical protein
VETYRHLWQAFLATGFLDLVYLQRDTFTDRMVLGLTLMYGTFVFHCHKVPEVLEGGSAHPTR